VVALAVNQEGKKVRADGAELRTQLVEDIATQAIRQANMMT